MALADALYRVFFDFEVFDELFYFPRGYPERLSKLPRSIKFFSHELPLCDYAIFPEFFRLATFLRLLQSALQA